MPSRSHAGFTLVELSIVLVIIGLVVGGVMTGKVLIQQAEIRAAASEMQNLETAYRTFQTKYGCIVGDCLNATELFGMNYVVVPNGCPPSGGAGNGNGDGNGFISSNSAIPGSRWYCEATQASVGLRLAYLLPTSYKTPCASSTFYYRGINDSCAYFYKDDLYNSVIPATNTNAISWAKYNQDLVDVTAPALSPLQARLIDEKIDDGIANKGKFRGLNSSDGLTSPLISGTCHLSGVYNNNENPACRALYYLK
jgi:prepilin-type N-terminal cleavage/methylation domain-containing protein